MDVSVICPFYNEAECIEQAVRQMHAQLERLGGEWELILVNDGSTDESLAVAEGIARRCPRVRVLSYADNCGRGHALRTGFAAAQGEIVVTTEMDLSWGATIVTDLVRYLRENRLFDIVVASPHLAGGGFRNIPASRVWLSRLANLFIRACLPGAVTMNTGMTRAYRRRALLSLPLHEETKVFHLEVIAKAHALGLAVLEVPAELDWTHVRRAGRNHAWRLFCMALAHIWYLMRTSPAQFACMLGLGALLLAFASLLIEQFGVLPDSEQAAPFSLSLFFFHTALAFLVLAIPCAGLSARLRHQWRRESEDLQAQAHAAAPSALSNSRLS